MLKLYKALEDVVTSDKTSGTEKAKCAEVAVNIAVDVLKLESEGIKAVKELVAKNEQEKNVLGNINNNCQSKNDESNNIQQDYDPNKKF